MSIMPLHQSVTKTDCELVPSNIYYQYIWKVKKFLAQKFKRRNKSLRTYPAY